MANSSTVSPPFPLPLLSPLPSPPSPSHIHSTHLPSTTEPRPGPLPPHATLTSGFVPLLLHSDGDAVDPVPTGDIGPRRPVAGGGGGAGGVPIRDFPGDVGGGKRDGGVVHCGGGSGCGVFVDDVVLLGGDRDGRGVGRGLGVGVGLGSLASLWSAGLGLGGRTTRAPRRVFPRPPPTPRPPPSRPPPRYSFVEVVGRCGPLPVAVSSIPSSRHAVVAAFPFSCRVLAEAVALVALAVDDSCYRTGFGSRGGAPPFSGLATPSSSAAAPAQGLPSHFSAPSRY